jgi:hypothetical protein
MARICLEFVLFWYVSFRFVRAYVRRACCPRSHRLRRQHGLGGLESEPVGLAVGFHESHEPIPLFGRSHNVRGFDRLRLSVGKPSVDIGRRELTLVVDHEHPRDLALGRRAGVKDVWVVEEKGGDSAGTVLGTGELDVGDALFFESTYELDGSV